MTRHEPSGTRVAAQRLVATSWFQWTIIGVILLNAVVIGLETGSRSMDRYGDLISTVSWVTIGIFVVEIALRIYAAGWSFFRDPWGVFDFLVVLVALIPSTGPFSVLRVLRVLRVMRLLSTVRSMRAVVGALVATIPGMASIAALLGMLLYISSVMATQLFGDTDPEHFGDLGTAVLSMFQITTGDDWANVIRPTTDAEPAAWAFFIFYIVLATYIVLNLFIAVAVEALDRETDESNEELAEELEEAMDESTAAIMRSLDELKAQVAALEARLGD